MKRIVAVVLSLVLAGCVTVPPKTFLVSEQQLQRRQVETRKYEGISETDLLVASSNTLQDLGFNLENSETKLGVLTASKQRDAVNPGEVAAAILVAMLGGGAMAISKDQSIRVALVIRPATDGDGRYMEMTHFVRITFQRVVRKTDNSVFAETLNDPELYQEFFDRVSKSVFLEAQKI
ncbi:hypothetical protein [Thauera propionica]|jgi:hypothetical protein|uniref:hypothetical protein n=1 Tax=Thauera propionica TaxID=2019431 RepID=UPI0023F39940|nr:hypothetical protein [Thauera propionica]MDD3676369.1 hypothetical protein [Thauera propionica]